jgi:hypothetical protein
LQLRVSFAKGLSLAARAGKVGGACLGLAVLVVSGEPAAILGLLAVVALVIGGMARAAGGRGATWVGILLPVSTVLAARVSAGPGAAALGAVLVALGALLHIRTGEVVLGLAVFGGIVVAAGGASARLLAIFWVLGFSLVALRTVAAKARLGLRRVPILKSEKARAVLLDPER